MSEARAKPDAALRKLHLGCGQRRIPGFCNIDVQPGA